MAAAAVAALAAAGLAAAAHSSASYKVQGVRAQLKHGTLRDVLSVNTVAGTDHVATTGVFGLQVLVDGAAV